MLEWYRSDQAGEKTGVDHQPSSKIFLVSGSMGASCQEPLSFANPCGLDEKPKARARNGAWSAARRHVFTVWLFTYSDLKTIIGPKTVFGVVSTLNADIFDKWTPPWTRTLGWVPLIACWTWINLLPFAIDNQRQPASIQEDKLNKPWRPMPAGRMSPTQAKILMLILYPIAIEYSHVFGGFRQCLTLLALGIWYNDLGGADYNPVVRNLINAGGFICYTSGAMEVAYGATLPLGISSPLLFWMLMIGCVVVTSVHSQDICDQEGDSIHGRRTVPLVIGDGASRVTVALAVLFWSFVVPWYWTSRPLGYALPLGLGSVVACRTWSKRKVGEDKLTFKLWNLWLVNLYILPFTRAMYGA